MSSTERAVILAAELVAAITLTAFAAKNIAGSPEFVTLKSGGSR